MGQKSNLITLQSKSKNLNLITQSPRTFLKSFVFLKNFERLLSKKNVIIDKKELNFESNRMFLNISLFFSSNKTLFYRKKGFSNLEEKLNNDIKNLFFKQFRKLDNNLLCIRVKNLNNFLDQNSLNLFYKNFKRFVGIFFNRRFNLFIDFVKINSLFLHSYVSTKVYLYLLGQIFRILPKSKHGRFLVFLKLIFKNLILASKDFEGKNKKSILGIKLIVSGKIKGKPRSSTTCIQVGSVPSQSLDKDVDFSKLHVYTLYGVFGFKIWIYKKLKN
jgi:hypothetical protein